jgi:hypothetical protein
MTRLSVGTSTERRFFAALNTVTKYFPETGKLAGIYAVALAAGARVDVRDSIARNTEGELSDLKRRYPEVASMAESAALNLMLLAERHRRDGKAELVLECLSKLKDIDCKQGSSRRIAEIRSGAIFYLMSSEAEEMFDASGLVGEERDIFLPCRFPESTLIASYFVGTVKQSACLSVERLDLLRELVSYLQEVFSAHSGNSEIIGQIKKRWTCFEWRGLEPSWWTAATMSCTNPLAEIRSLFENFRISTN